MKSQWFMLMEMLASYVTILLNASIYADKRLTATMQYIIMIGITGEAMPAIF